MFAYTRIHARKKLLKFIHKIYHKKGLTIKCTQVDTKNLSQKTRTIKFTQIGTQNLSQKVITIKRTQIDKKKFITK